LVHVQPENPANFHHNQHDFVLGLFHWVATMASTRDNLENMKPANEAIAKLNRAIIVALGAVSFFLCPTISIGEIECFVIAVGEIAGGQGSTDINSKGQVTGASYFVTLHGFIYDGKMRDIGTLGGSVSEGFSINDNGQITGESQLAENSTRHAFLYDGTTMHDLGDLGGNFSEGFGSTIAGTLSGLRILRGQQRTMHFCTTERCAI
jgi:probable HAF family extracellular repeat protein